MAVVDELNPQPPADTLDWQPVMTWWHRLASDFDAGHWEAPVEQEDGSCAMGYAVLSDEAQEFIQLLYEYEIVAGFDWPGWMNGRGGDLIEHQALIDEAGLEDCRRLLTAIARGDRFNEGLFLDKLRDGTIRRILQRVAILLEST